MSRVQIALRVADLESSIAFYRKLLGAEPAKRRPGYAVQDKVWVTGPGRERWEVYTVLADARPDLEGQTGGEVDCDQTACSCQAPDSATAQR